MRRNGSTSSGISTVESVVFVTRLVGSTGLRKLAT